MLALKREIRLQTEVGSQKRVKNQWEPTLCNGPRKVPDAVQHEDARLHHSSLVSVSGTTLRIFIKKNSEDVFRHDRIDSMAFESCTKWIAGVWRQ